MSYRIAVVVGSLRRASWNRALAHAVISLAPADFSFEFVEIGELPLYSQDYDADFPEVAKRFKQSIEAADAAVLHARVQPLDPGRAEECAGLGPRPWGSNSWSGKPGAVLGTSPGATGTALTAAPAQRARVSRREDARAARDVHQARSGAHRRPGQIVSEDTRKFLQGFVDRYTDWVRLLKSA